jgi:poly-gamma-glutamate capsule biosynthesis protein CapA/YwtB (metallophosphatase superfamily)
MLGRGVADARSLGGWEGAMQSLYPLTQSADLALANLESPIGCVAPDSAGLRSLVAPPEAVGALVSAGLDVLSMVNNHALDGGLEAVRCTTRALTSRGITVLDSPSAPVEISIHGLNILFLAFDFTGDITAGAVKNLERIIRDASEAGKIVVVSLHWGMEFHAGHDSLQQQIAERLAEAHADILWGHHPHVVQEIEWLNSTLVLYSLGNALFDQLEPETTRRGTLVWVDLDRRGVRSIGILPFAIDPRQGRTGSFDFFRFKFFWRDSIPLGI